MGPNLAYGVIDGIKVPGIELKVWLEELSVEQLVSLLSSLKLWFVSESEGRNDNSFPLETTYTLQKVGQLSDIFADNVRALKQQCFNTH